MRKWKVFVGLILPVAVTVYLALWYYRHVHYLAVIGPVVITGLVIDAMCSPTPSATRTDLSKPVELDEHSRQALLAFYDKTIEMHVKTDSGMFQIVGIFVPASLLVLGWALSTTDYDKITPDVTAIVGSTSIVLVGIATLIKHRLRYYNKIREIYLRHLEEVILAPEMAPNWGLHNFTRDVYTPSGTPFHMVVDIYYFIHIGVWIIHWLSKF